MRTGDRVQFQGRTGTLLRFMPAGMADIQFDDVPHIERRSTTRLSPAGSAARPNSGSRKGLRLRERRMLQARRNPVQLTRAAHKSYVDLLSALRAKLALYEEELRVAEAVGIDPRNPPMARVLESKAGEEAKFANIPISTARGRVLAQIASVEKKLAGVEIVEREEEEIESVGWQASTPEEMETERQRLSKGRAEQQKRIAAEQERFYAKKPGPPAGKVKVRPIDEAWMKTQLRERGAVMWSELDLPRLSADRGDYCGNPIDGVRYYISVTDERRDIPRWIKNVEVAQAAADHGIRAVQVPLEALPFAHAMAEIDKEPGTEEEKRGRRAEIERRSGPLWSAVRYAAFFLGTYLPKKEEQPGTRVYVHKATPRKYMRSKAKMGLREELAIKERKAEAAGMEPVAKDDFSFPDPKTGVPTYFQLHSSGSPGPRRLMRFSPFARRQFTAVKAPTLAESIHVASKRDPALAPLGISIPTVQALIVSGAVEVDGQFVLNPVWAGHPDAMGGPPRLSGAKITIYLREKAESPFFSWVRATTPIREAGILAKCLSGDDKKLRAELETMRRLFARLDGTMGRVQGLFARLARDPGSLRPTDVQDIVAKLAKTYAKLLHWLKDIVERAAEGDSAAGKAYKMFESTALKPADQQSPFWRLRGVQEDEQFDFTVLLDYALARMRLGRAALLFFAARPEMKEQLSAWTAGKVTVLPHPMDDLWAFVRPSLAPESAAQLGVLREQAGTGGVVELRTARPGPRSPSRDVREKLDPALGAAVEFGDLVGQYAIGGERTNRGYVDPQSQTQPFDLRVPPSWPVGAHQQIDTNWALQRIVNEVFPTLVWDRGAPPDAAAGMCRDLVLLVFLYDLIGGYTLFGPLNPLTKSEPGLLRRTWRQVEDAEAQLLGGKRALSEPGTFTTYSTYNPVLYELTRLFWPSRGREGADPAWGSFLAHWPELKHLDNAGIYGSVRETTEKLAARLGPEGVAARIHQLLSPVSGVLPPVLLTNKTGKYAVFLLSWPIGMPYAKAAGMANEWIRDPLRYLSQSKPAAEGAVGATLEIQREGLPESTRWPPSEMPRLYQDRPITIPESSVFGQVPVIEKLAVVNRVLQEIDRNIGRHEQAMGLGEPE